MTHLNEAGPLDPLGHKYVPQGPESCLWECGIDVGTFFYHSYCQARNKHRDYFITTTHPL